MCNSELQKNTGRGPWGPLFDRSLWSLNLTTVTISHICLSAKTSPTFLPPLSTGPSMFLFPSYYKVLSINLHELIVFFKTIRILQFFYKHKVDEWILMSVKLIYIVTLMFFWIKLILSDFDKPSKDSYFLVYSIVIYDFFIYQSVSNATNNRFIWFVQRLE